MQSVSFREDIMGAGRTKPCDSTAGTNHFPRISYGRAVTRTSSGSDICKRSFSYFWKGFKGCPRRPFNFSAPVIPVKTSDATVGSKHNAGIATASSVRFEIHFIYPASGVYALFAC